jgi:hypothetical protein
MFWDGKPDNSLSAAGVLLRQFDSQSDYDNGRPWLSCPQSSWCSTKEQYWPASLINRQVRKLYYEDKAGFILDPERAKVLCACQGDCNSNSQASGLRGCSATQCCDYPEPQCVPHHVDHDCSYPPDQLYEALAAQVRRGVPTHNEVVLDNIQTAAKMPDAILAFFYMSELSREEARTMHRNFLNAYKLTEEACPLVRLTLQGDADPFAAIHT